MAAIEFKWSDADVKFWREANLEKALVKSLKMAGRDALRTLRTDASRYVRDRKRVKLSRVRKGLPLTFPRGKATIDSLVWRMDVDGRVTRAIEQPHRQLRRGVSVAINRGKRSLIKGAFIATMSNGYTGVFIRRTSKPFPLDHVVTSRISDVFGDRGMIPEIHRRSASTFHVTFHRVMPLEVSKLRK